MLKQQAHIIERTLDRYKAGRALFRALCVVASIFPLKKTLRLWLLRRSLQSAHGPARIAADSSKAVVLCVVKDGESLIQAFIEHYLNLGFSHIFFLDNGSTDRTAEIIRANQQTTLFSSHKPFRRYFDVFKNFLILTCGRGHWCVVADIDEFLHFPLDRELKDITAYLNQHEYDAVCIQMLDMFSKEGIQLSNQVRAWTLSELESVFRYYDIEHIKQRNYVRRFQPNIYPDLKFFHGGIRKTVFDRNCFLTKETMFFARRGTRLKSSHLLNYARLADFSVVYLHYKFVEDFYTKTIEAVKTKSHWHDSAEYKGYLAVLEKAIIEQKTVFSLLQPHSHELNAIDDLIETNFLFVSEQFRTSSKQPDAHSLPSLALEV
ncbi:hypothetical protein S7335_4167 [Synechococcus sp. PCC 7335]|uniref:glycosyltransferase family 2 protein n=1 Tax=Synechococcus sp. (strain ATCC 29403 / PCC 7335) TaxID=91464 RepID=UPI00017EC6FF|nr:glycosyltransferase family 2 protein [Synechococcus sp. PCC 7335]EDX86463.1 hypothetical protein S7335_4167 [Synechococcus sp. PCC 7335]